MSDSMAKLILDDACARLERALNARRVEKVEIVKKGATLYSVRTITVKA